MTNVIRTTANTAGWGLFLTSSWTWCIGMWLPSIMLFRYGWPGFWVFAIPNVLGCAIMGYLLRSREASTRMVAAHRGPMRWFSVATIAYQLFFLSYIFGIGDPETDVSSALYVPLLAWAVALIGSWLPWKAWPWFGTLIFAASMTTWIIRGTGLSIDFDQNEPDQDLWLLAPLIILGFLACPWLDPTFHRARQLAASKHAFGVFGVTFLVMLLFVASYCLPYPASYWELIVAFFCYQTIFTMSAHLREIRLLEAPDGWGTTGILTGLTLIGVAIGYGMFQVCCEELIGPWLLDTYLRFLALYGLVFPAWILAFMLGRGRRTPGRYLILAIGLLIALPMAEIGMLHASKWWLIPAVLIVIATAAVISSRQRDKKATPAA